MSTLLWLKSIFFILNLHFRFIHLLLTFSLAYIIFQSKNSSFSLLYCSLQIFLKLWFESLGLWHILVWNVSDLFLSLLDLLLQRVDLFYLGLIQRSTCICDWGDFYLWNWLFKVFLSHFLKFFLFLVKLGLKVFDCDLVLLHFFW